MLTKILKFLSLNGKSLVLALFFIWPVRSIDTMKTSRDLALSELNDSSYVAEIDREVSLIAQTGANYVAVDTPYDNQFLPYLKEWVASVRTHGLNVWFRGSFSGFEGWFGYDKSLKPSDLLLKTSTFIINNPDLFADNDIFDPCPECENAGYWPQPKGNASYNQFLKEKNNFLKNAFAKINKKVIINFNSIIGGRAKEVVTKDTANSLGDTIAIDHYASSPKSYDEYINYFAKNLNSKTVVSEFGAPVPGIHPEMDEWGQAGFIDNVMDVVYKNKKNVVGINYWVLNGGTTALVNDDGTARKVFQVVKNYFSPAAISGNVINDIQRPVKNVKITTQNNSVGVDDKGNYLLVVPANKSETVVVETDGYIPQSYIFQGTNQELVIKNFILKPKRDNIFGLIFTYLKSLLGR